MHAVRQYGDLATASDGVNVVLQQIVAVPTGKVDDVLADLARRCGAQLVIIPEAGIGDPLRGARYRPIRNDIAARKLVLASGLESSQATASRIKSR